MDLIDRERYAGGITKRPECPRCGYQLGGVLAAYKETCPLGSTCSECGFEFEWAKVMRPDWELPRWFFECVPRWTFWSSIVTLMRLSLPPHFFNRIYLWFAPQPKRLLGWILLQLVSAYAIVTFAKLAVIALAMSGVAQSKNGFVSLGGSRYVYANDDSWTQILNAILAPLGGFEASQYYYGASPSALSFQFSGISSATVCVMFAALAWPIALLLLRPTRRLARIRKDHLLRASVYSLWWLLVIIWCRVACGVFVAANGVMEILNPSAGRSILERIEESDLWYVLHEPDSLFEVVGLMWSPFTIAIVAGALLWQVWWWYCVMVRHWRLPSGRAAWALLCAIAMCLALLATIGRVSYAYIFMNM